MRHRLGLVAALALSIAACGPAEEARESVSIAPVSIDDQEGAVCGMLVRDQSAPRAQVIHRDGERSFLCSIGDLLAYLEVPSPSGEPLEVLVEVMEPDEDPLASHPEPHPWVSAAEAVYVIGIPRRGIMGEPVLVYVDVETAEQVTAGTSARLVDFAELQRWWAARDDE
jgi:nitrous oxide reductase accessory protein NosL